jgi:hypothetical protein
VTTGYSIQDDKRYLSTNRIIIIIFYSPLTLGTTGKKRNITYLLILKNKTEYRGNDLNPYPQEKSIVLTYDRCRGTRLSTHFLPRTRSLLNWPDEKRSEKEEKCNTISKPDKIKQQQTLG